MRKEQREEIKDRLSKLNNAFSAINSAMCTIDMVAATVSKLDRQGNEVTVHDRCQIIEKATYEGYQIIEDLKNFLKECK